MSPYRSTCGFVFMHTAREYICIARYLSAQNTSFVLFYGEYIPYHGFLALRLTQDDTVHTIFAQLLPSVR